MSDCATILGLRGVTPKQGYQLEWSPRDFNKDYRIYEKGAIKKYGITNNDVGRYRRAMELNSAEGVAMLKRLNMTSNEVRAKILEARKAVSQMTPSKTKYFNSTTKTYTAERQALHTKAIKHFVPESATTENTVLMTGGVPASGKSSMLNHPAIKERFKKPVYLDPDDIKSYLAKADGIEKLTVQASIYHEESVDVMVEVLRRALEEKKAVILDSTMRQEGKIIKIIQQVKSKGYNIELAYNDLPIEKAMVRSIERYIAGGRFVDPIYIATHDGKNIQVFGKIKRYSEKWLEFDADVAYGKLANLRAISKILEAIKEETNIIFYEKFDELQMYYAINDGEEIYMDALVGANFAQDCYSCVHFNADKRTCPAFPEGIPTPFITSQQRHFRKERGQEGDYIFTAKKEKK